VAADASAQITELTVDDHACLTFGEEDELFDVTAAFVRDGLAGGLKVMWLSDAGPGSAVTELSRRGIAVEPAMAAGQMTADGGTCCPGRSSAPTRRSAG
jgi:MEDS: MEthanogen/methylotroph, DcmR Sensory domain